MERKGKVTFLGKPLTLAGTELKIGDKAADFTVLDKELKEVRFKDFTGKVKFISVTPSLDTPVCEMQARRFNQEAGQLPDSVVIMNISMDLPFAIARFSTTAGIDRIQPVCVAELSLKVEGA